MNKKKNYLITGSCGFIGFNFLFYLNKRDMDVGKVIGLDKISDISISETPKVNNIDFKFVKGHTSNTDLIFELLKEYNIDYLIDFAASSHVDLSISQPDVFFKDNIEGKYGLSKACLKYQKEINENFKLINISTDEVYGFLNVNDKSFTEETPYNPTNPYSASKACGDLLCNSYFKTFGLNVITTHSCNNYGPFQDITKMIPKIITNALNNKEIPIYGKGKQIREWIHVEQHCDAIYFLLKYGKLGEKYNIGSGIEYKNIDLVDKIQNRLYGITGIDSNHLKRFVTDRQAHDFRYSINCDKLKKLGWQNWKLDFDLALEQTIKWYHQKHQEKV